MPSPTGERSTHRTAIRRERTEPEAGTPPREAGIEALRFEPGRAGGGKPFDRNTSPLHVRAHLPWSPSEMRRPHRFLFLSAAGLVVATTFTLVNVPARAAIPAFPGAVGYGASASGGRGGRVLRVTTLAAQGPGSLQAALDATGPRIVVFAVSGVIEGDVEVTHGDVTVAGQTAPGAGLTIHGRLSGAYTASVTNIVVRHVRVRPPPLTEPSAKGNLHDAIQFSRNSMVMLDHVSASWASDETVDLYEAKDVTLQDSTVEESSTTGHPEGLHNYGLIVGPDATRVSVVRTLFAHHFRRAPAFATGPLEFRNNVVFDVRDGFVHDNGAEGAFHVVGNVWKRGRSSRIVPFALEDEDPTTGDPLYIVRDNRIDDPGKFVGIVGDPFTERSLHPSFGELPRAVATGNDGPMPGLAYPVRTSSPDEAYRDVLTRAGAFPRDSVTRRTIEETRTRCGHWGAKPTTNLLEGLTASSAPPDTDGDGMPDAWEASRGLSPSDAGDGTRVLEGEYTAIEVYLNELADTLVRTAGVIAPDTEGPCPDVAPSFDQAVSDRKSPPIGCSCDSARPTSTETFPSLLVAALTALFWKRARRPKTPSPSLDDEGGTRPAP